MVSDPEIMNGAPCFRDTRVPFQNLIDYLEGGHSLREFLLQFPAVSTDSGSTSDGTCLGTKSILLNRSGFKGLKNGRLLQEAEDAR